MYRPTIKCLVYWVFKKSAAPHWSQRFLFPPQGTSIRTTIRSRSLLVYTGIDMSLLIFSVHEEGYFRNMSCALNLISTFFILILLFLKYVKQRNVIYISRMFLIPTVLMTPYLYLYILVVNVIVSLFVWKYLVEEIKIIIKLLFKRNTQIYMNTLMTFRVIRNFHL
jgi:hypothetical protein